MSPIATRLMRDAVEDPNVVAFLVSGDSEPCAYPALWR